MSKPTIVALVLLVALGAGLGSAQAGTPQVGTHHAALPHFGIRVGPTGNIVEIGRTSRDVVDSAFNFVYATCDECGTGCPPLVRTIHARLQANAAVAAGYGVSDLVSVNYTVTGVTMSPNGTALAIGDYLDITITGNIVSCSSYFSVWFSMCDEAPADPHTACGETVSNVIINEVLADPDTSGVVSLGDANNDGIASGTDDEFLEIVNVSGGDLDVSGWTIYDAVPLLRHTFPAGSVIAADCVGVVFGGGTPTGPFGGASFVQTASTTTLGLNNTAETINIYNASAGLEATVTWGAEGGNNQSITRDPDITGGTPLVLHSTATGSGGALFSPGRMIDGTSFSGCDETAPQVERTTPLNGGTGVAVNANVAITFSEPVATGAGWFGISCGTSGSHTAAETGGPLTFTLNPDADFAYGETCTVTVYATQVTDLDAIPPDNMAADYVFSFSTVPDLAPTVTSTTPSNGAGGVAIETDISITFSEAVTASAGWYGISCATSGGHTAVASGGPTTFTLNPDSNFANNELCTVTVYAANVADQDGTPTNMAANYVFTFTTVTGSGPTYRINEQFTHADGALNTQVPVPGPGGAWTMHSGAAGQIQVTSGYITLKQSTYSEDTHTAWTTALAAGQTVYAGFDLTVPDPGAAISTNVYFAHFSLTNGTTFNSRVWIMPPTTAGYRMGISATSTAPGAAAITPDLSFGTTYRVVHSYNFDTGDVQLWIYQGGTLLYNRTNTDADTASQAFLWYAFRDAAHNTWQVIDNLLVGDALADVD